MKMEIDWRKRYIKMKSFALVLFIMLFITFLVFGGMALGYKVLYKEAIKQGAENIMTALQMTSACMKLGNFTQKDITRATIEMFILEDSYELNGDKQK